MSFTAFMANPKAYLRTHRVFVHSTPAGENSVTAGAAVVNAAGGNSMQFTLHAGNHSRMDIGANQGTAGFNIIARAARRVGIGSWARRDYTLVANPGDLGFRYLPYRPNHVTYMSLDAAATFCLTGPLTGCTIAAARDAAGTVWFLHANRNNIGGVVAARLPKRTMILNVTAGLGILPANVTLCEYGAGFQYDGMGFVFGKLRGNGDWRFRVHSSSPVAGGGQTTATTLLGDV